MTAPTDARLRVLVDAYLDATNDLLSAALPIARESIAAAQLGALRELDDVQRAAEDELIDYLDYLAEQAELEDE